MWVKNFYLPLVGDVELRFRDEVTPYLANVIFGNGNNGPAIIHANGPAKNLLNSFGNYLPRGRNANDQCTACWKDNLIFDELLEIPQVILGVFIEQATPFIEEFFDKLLGLDYPKVNIDLLIHNAVEYHAKDVANFLKRVEKETYHLVKIIHHSDKVKEVDARNAGIQHCHDIK